MGDKPTTSAGEKAPHPNLARAESYYFVARDLRMQANLITDTALMLERMGDEMCERAMAEQSPDPTEGG